MTKMTLGNDFSNDDGANSSKVEEADEIISDDESEDENENSGDTADTENNESGNEVDSTDSKDDAKDPDESTKPENKKGVLDALLDTEKGIDADLGSIDEQITAARIRISEKRGKRRIGRELTGNLDIVIPPETEEETDDLKDIDPETIKLLERFTKAKGLVPKSELGKIQYQTVHKTAESKFYESHPQYLPENDTDDSLYNALKEELSYFATPKSPDLIPKLFEKAHEQVAKKYPGKFVTVKKNVVDTSAAEARISRQRLGGGSGSSGGKQGKADDAAKPRFSDAQIRALQDGGWSDEDIKRLNNKQ